MADHRTSHPLAIACREKAEWRDYKGREDPGDTSSAASAPALRALADYIDGLPPDDSRLVAVQHITDDRPDMWTQDGERALTRVGLGSPTPLSAQLEHLVAEELSGFRFYDFTYDVADLLENASDERNPVLALAFLASARSEVELESEMTERDQVKNAREAGVSWGNIANVLRTTKSTIWRKYAAGLGERNAD